MIEILCSAAAKDKKMKAIAIGIFAAIGMYVFGTRPLVKAFGGEMALWVVLIVDLIVGVLAYVIAA